MHTTGAKGSNTPLKQYRLRPFNILQSIYSIGGDTRFDATRRHRKVLVSSRIIALVYGILRDCDRHPRVVLFNFLSGMRSDAASSPLRHEELAWGMRGEMEEATYGFARTEPEFVRILKIPDLTSPKN